MSRNQPDIPAADGRVTLSAKRATFAEPAGTFAKRRRKTPATLDEMQEAIVAGAARGFQRRGSKPE